jgi:hypothetical protein
LRRTPAASWIRVGLFALPAYGLLTAYATLEPQPDQASDPDGWARFVSSTSYLVGHVIGNVLGTALAIFGTFALGAFLATSRAARLALWGMVLAVAGHILFTVPGAISTFATPAIGTAYLAGNRDVMALEFSDVVTAIIALGLLLAVIGNTILGVAIWRSGTLPRWAWRDLGRGDVHLLRSRCRPRHGHDRRQPAHPASRRCPSGRQRRLDRLVRSALTLSSGIDGRCGLACRGFLVIGALANGDAPVA